jgi:hypothetical protein
MRLGLIADIHEEVEYLRRAIAALKASGVAQFVVLGDVFETGKRIDATVAELSGLVAVGVWGNHDFGLCRDVSDDVRGRYSEAVLGYFQRLEPCAEIGPCWFQHIEPYLDSNRLDDLWAYGGEGVLDPGRSFAACRHRRIFMGHVHRWELITPSGRVAWPEGAPVRLRADDRYLVVVHGVQQGWCAWYDLEHDVLCRLRVAEPGAALDPTA